MGEGLFGGGTGSENATTTELFFDIFYPLVLVIFIGMIVFIGTRAYRYASSYAGDGEPLGPYKFHIQGLTSVKGNLSRHYFITDAEYELLKTLDHLEVAEDIQTFRDRIENGDLYIYDFRVTDYDEAFDLHGGQDSIILSPVDLEDNIYGTLDVKGERSLVSPTFRIKHTNIMCFSASRYYGDQVMAERDVDIYDLVPIPKIITSMKLQNEQQVVLFMKKLANAKGDAVFSEYLRTISENWQEIAPLRDEIDRLRKRLVGKDIELSDLHRAGEHDRHIAYTNPIIGHRKKDKLVDNASKIGVYLAMFFIGGMTALAPEGIPNVNISGMITLLIGGGILGFVLYMVYESKGSKSKEEEKTN